MSTAHGGVRRGMTGTSLYETHSHTPLCKHAIGDPQDYAAMAFRRGFQGLLVTCHNPMPAGFSPGFRMSVDEFDDYLQMVFRARQIWRGRIDVRLGIEADYLPGYERWLEHQLQLSRLSICAGLGASPRGRIPAAIRERQCRGSPAGLFPLAGRSGRDAAV